MTIKSNCQLLGAKNTKYPVLYMNRLGFIKGNKAMDCCF